RSSPWKRTSFLRLMLLSSATATATGLTGIGWSRHNPPGNEAMHTAWSCRWPFRCPANAILAEARIRPVVYGGKARRTSPHHNAHAMPATLLLKWASKAGNPHGHQVEIGCMRNTIASTVQFPASRVENWTVDAMVF